MIRHTAPLNSQFGRAFLNTVSSLQDIHSEVMSQDEQSKDLDKTEGQVTVVRSNGVVKADQDSMQWGDRDFSFDANQIELSRNDLFDCKIRADLKANTVTLTLKEPNAEQEETGRLKFHVSETDQADYIDRANEFVQKKLNRFESLFHRENNRWFGNDSDQDPNVFRRLVGSDLRVEVRDREVTVNENPKGGPWKHSRLKGKAGALNQSGSHDWSLQQDFRDSIVSRSWNADINQFTIEIEPTNIEKFAERVATRPSHSKAFHPLDQYLS